MPTINLHEEENFLDRHNGSALNKDNPLFQSLNIESISELIQQTLPDSIKMKKQLKLPKALSEKGYLKRIKKISKKNKIYNSFIGQGYYGTIVPTVIQRNILENPGWYTAYTPYQAEIAQGRLEALVNFQTLVTDLTQMEVANASLLDEGTAAAEAMSMLYAIRKKEKVNAHVFWVDNAVFPQTLEVLKTRAEPLGIAITVKNLETVETIDDNVFGIFFQYPNNAGALHNAHYWVQNAHNQGVLSACSTDLLALTLLTPPGEWGIDVVVGSTQRLGVPMGYGGPHAAFFATREKYKRNIPGRIIGISKDKYGNLAYRMALQTREQHIKREKATSNICTYQVLLAVMASMYAVYHGAEGLKKIALKIKGLANLTSDFLQKLKIKNKNTFFFDTLCFELGEEEVKKLKQVTESEHINLRYDHNTVMMSFDETHTLKDAQKIIQIFAKIVGEKMPKLPKKYHADFPDSLARKTPFLTHPTFHNYRTESELLRYIKSLENKDLSLVHSMISLGSCTMKLNATTEMLPISWPEFSNIHPFAPPSQTQGYDILLKELASWLIEITGLFALSFQPNSGSQGEFSGLLVIKNYLKSIGQEQRNIALIPTSAHGTNFASAIMAGLKVVLVACDSKGNIDWNDLKEKSTIHAQKIAVFMVTYPSTHGVFELSIKEMCEWIHTQGGQVYLDGANMNAQVGLTSPQLIGADVCHLNLHKTFCIPHGGGGPGMGPIAVAAHLAPFLPGHLSTDNANPSIASAPFSSASILPITHAYISLMGRKGLKKATQLAILNANYLAHRLKGHYTLLFTNKLGRCAHEFIIDCREFKKVGVEVEDIAKRLMDYGFHAPTMSFPVPGTLMIEPTESESQAELDRFCDAMIGIRREIQEIQNGDVDRVDNVLKNAPHTYWEMVSENGNCSYSREKAVFPTPYVKKHKFWPSVSRIDNAYGDRNLFCSCINVEDFNPKN